MENYDSDNSETNQNSIKTARIRINLIDKMRDSNGEPQINRTEIFNKDKTPKLLKIRANKVNKSRFNYNSYKNLKKENEDLLDEKLIYMNNTLINLRRVASATNLKYKKLLDEKSSLLNELNEYKKVHNNNVNQMLKNNKNYNKLLKYNKQLININRNLSSENTKLKKDLEKNNLKYNKLSQEKKNLELWINSQNSEIIQLKKELTDSDKIIKQLKKEVQFYKANYEQLKNKENSNIINPNEINVTFNSVNQKINEEIKCFINEPFINAEEKILQKYPQYRDKKIVYLAQGEKINKLKTFEENKITSNVKVIVIINEKEDEEEKNNEEFDNYSNNNQNYFQNNETNAFTVQNDIEETNYITNVNNDINTNNEIIGVPIIDQPINDFNQNPENYDNTTTTTTVLITDENFAYPENIVYTTTSIDMNTDNMSINVSENNDMNNNNFTTNVPNSNVRVIELGPINNESF